MSDSPIDTTGDELIHNIEPNAKCPNCNADMWVAGWYSKPAQMHDGKSNQRTECLKCGKTVTPKARTE